MNTNLNTPIPAARAITGEGWAAIVGAIGSAFLLAKKLLSRKASQARAGQPGRVLRRDAGPRGRTSTPTTLPSWRSSTPTTGSCSPTLERQVTRINALEAGLARVDERTRNVTVNEVNVQA